MNANEFRAELMKIMPGYSWTVHKQYKYPDIPKDEWPLSATGIQSSGSNRLSTLYAIRRVREGRAVYEVKSSGYGTRAPWLHEYHDGTLARALRGLQDHYEGMAATYRSHAEALKLARFPIPDKSASIAPQWDAQHSQDVAHTHVEEGVSS